MPDLRTLLEELAAMAKQPAPRWFGRRRHAAEQKYRTALLQTLEALAAENVRFNENARLSAGRFEAFREHAEARLQSLATQNRQWLETIETLRAQLAQHETRIQTELPSLVENASASLQRQLSLQAQDLARHAVQLRQMLDEAVASQQQAVAELGQRHGAEASRLEEELRRQQEQFTGKIQELQKSCEAEIGKSVAEIAAARDQAEKSLAAAQAALASTQDTRTEISAEFASLLDRVTALAAAATRPAPDPGFFRFYMELERRHRGSRDLIVRRLAQYSTHLDSWAAAFLAGNTGRKLLDLATYDPRTAHHDRTRVVRTIADLPALDLGCGRGEWLQYLTQNKWRNIAGVDRNPLMIAECRKHGNLPVLEADLLESLRALPASSLALLTGFHVAEHLSFADLRELAAQALRVLHPGGICVFETPNPENLLTASLYFHLDPTHRKPLPVDLLKLVLEQAGFAEPETLRFQPNADLGFKPDTLPAQHADPTVQLLLNHFRANQDYALIARRP